MKKIVVIKIGGNVIDNPEALSDFLINLSQIDSPYILVHGGGKIATEIGARMDIVPVFHEGRRITDEKTIDLVSMVYAGLLNKKIVAKLQSLKVNAIGVCGADANLIPAIKRPVKEIDFGFVGDVQPNSINTAVLTNWLEDGIMPIFAPITHDGKGQLLNTNADTIAAVLAVALSEFYEIKLMYCFEKKGVLKQVDDEDSVIPTLNKVLYQQLKSSGSLHKGILPKIENAFFAVENGVKEVSICYSDELNAKVSDANIGTRVVL